jgi:hypothetical protein
MGIKAWSGRSLLLRAAGVLMLVAGWRMAVDAVPLGQGHEGHEPAVVYGLCLFAFVCASAGAALLANGAALFGKVRCGALWTPHLGD